MKTHFKTTLNFCCFLFLCCIILFSCTKDNSEGSLNDDPISGTWFLIKVNDTDVSDIDCYRDSFIESNGETITFFIQDRLQNGNCETVLSNTKDVTNEDGFYYLGDEVIEIYIEGNTLSWRVDVETSLEFEK